MKLKDYLLWTVKDILSWITNLTQHLKFQEIKTLFFVVFSCFQLSSSLKELNTKTQAQKHGKSMNVLYTFHQ